MKTLIEVCFINSSGSKFIGTELKCVKKGTTNNGFIKFHDTAKIGEKFKVGY